MKTLVCEETVPFTWRMDYDYAFPYALQLGTPLSETKRTIAAQTSAIVHSADVFCRGLAGKLLVRDHMSCRESRSFVEAHAPRIEFADACIETAQALATHRRQRMRWRKSRCVYTNGGAAARRRWPSTVPVM
jgi:hypothetical protein